jgi:hypothetical protein
MPLAIFVSIFKFVAEIVRVLLREAREVKAQPLWVDCLHALRSGWYFGGLSLC